MNHLGQPEFQSVSLSPKPLRRASATALGAFKNISRTLVLGTLASVGCSNTNAQKENPVPEKPSVYCSDIFDPEETILSVMEESSPSSPDIEPSRQITTPFEETVLPASFPHFFDQQSAVSGSFQFVPTPLIIPQHEFHFPDQGSSVDSQESADPQTENSSPLNESVAPRISKPSYTLQDLKVVDDSSPLLGLLLLFSGLSASATVLVVLERLQALKNQQALDEYAARSRAS